MRQLRPSHGGQVSVDERSDLLINLPLQRMSHLHDYLTLGPHVHDSDEASHSYGLHLDGVQVQRKQYVQHVRGHERRYTTYRVYGLNSQGRVLLTGGRAADHRRQNGQVLGQTGVADSLDYRQLQLEVAGLRVELLENLFSFQFISLLLSYYCLLFYLCE